MFWVVLWIVCAVAGFIIGDAKGRAALGLILGLLLGLIGLLIIALLPAEPRWQGAPQGPTGPTTGGPALGTATTSAPELRLAQLERLRSRGVLSEEEYQAQRARIIAQL